MAARLVAEDELADVEIAKRARIGKSTLERWKQRPDFQAAVAAHRERFRDAMLREGFADKRLRVRALNLSATAVYRKLMESDFTAKRVIGTAESFVEFDVFDEERVRQFRGLLDDIAKELGERQTGAGATASAAVVVKVYGDARMENPLDADWSDAPAPRSSADR
ncbi:MAG TPA: hypothetical protein VF041_23320 [Gemmatimonadaceae bacterium]